MNVEDKWSAVQAYVQVDIAIDEVARVDNRAQELSRVIE